MSEDELLTVAEVAERLKVGRETVRRWLKQGRLHGMMIGGTKAGYRIPRSQLERLLKDGSGAL